jgi:regulator of RNase E activity RraA
MGGMRTRTIPRVRPLNPDACRFAGPAFTVRTVPIREDYSDRASMVNPKNPLYGTFDTIPAGSVVVMDMGGVETAGAIGDVLVAGLLARGVVGFVTDGAMRDGDAVGRMALPVFCTAVAPPPVGQARLTAGVNQPIGCGGVLVEPGDIVVGDADGVVVIPRHLADAVAEKGAEKDLVEAWVRTRIEAGEKVTGLYPPDDAVVAAWRKAEGAKR